MMTNVWYFDCLENIVLSIIFLMNMVLTSVMPELGGATGLPIFGRSINPI